MKFILWQVIAQDGQEEGAFVGIQEACNKSCEESEYPTTSQKFKVYWKMVRKQTEAEEEILSIAYR